MLGRGNQGCERTPAAQEGSTIPRPKRQLNPQILRYLKASDSARAETRGLGRLKPVEPAARWNGVPLLGADQVYVMKHGWEYHTAWCQVVADKWDSAPRRLLVALLADVGSRRPCRACGLPLNAAGESSERNDPGNPMPAPELPPNPVIPLAVVGLAHGILFLAAGVEHRERLSETAVEPATPLLVAGLRDGMVVRIETSRDEPLLVIQLDPRATFRNGPYQVRLRRPLQRSGTKPYAVESVEPAPHA